MADKKTPADQSGNKEAVFSTPQLYEAIVKHLPVGFSLVDEEGSILEFNPARDQSVHLIFLKVVFPRVFLNHPEVLHPVTNPG